MRLLTIPFILLALFIRTDYNLSNEEMLDLTTVETVRVSLFNATPPSVIRINAVDHEIQFSVNGESFDLKPGDGFVYMRPESSKITLNYGQKSIRAEHITITNGSGGLTQFFTPQLGNRVYHGNFEFEINRAQNSILIVNSVALEHYIASVVGSEMNFNNMEALKSQAVVARTYALWNIHHTPYRQYHLKDNEQNQVYLGALRSRPDYEEAAQATSGEILTWSDKLVLTAFSSTCGGVTSSNETVWSGEALPYLRSTSDGDMCSMSPHFEWEFSITEQELTNLISGRYGFHYQSYSTKKDPAGRVKSITFVNRENRELTFNGNEFRLLVNRTFGALGLRSTKFDTHTQNGSITFTGKGLGHGVGLCQWGARGFAEAGWGYHEILSFYFSGTNIVDFHTIDNQKIALSK